MSLSGDPAYNANERWKAAANNWENSKGTPGEQTACGQVMSKAKDASAYCRQNTMPSALQQIASADYNVLANGCCVPRERY
ncbi:hypothetical protein I302_106519 [Kwoniella bestiolae CBS 10118]|uniref:Uncharacterized protein n=1 Tax=Kwoniella bestiolae CBS 10118 TaxID=1296100 RepID=A0AAJ8KBG3_9TREE